MDYKDRIDKGRTGEQVTIDTLKSLYPSAVITHASAKQKSGDILLKVDGIKCMIEVKNKSTMQQADIAKFIRDVMLRTKHKTINCALFISLDQQFIYDKTAKRGKQFHIEQICNIPIIYVYADNADADKLRLTIDHLITYLKDNPVTKIITYKSADTLANETYAYFTQDTPPVDLDDIDTNAYKYISNLLASTTHAIPKSQIKLTIERSKYMYLEHLLPMSRRLIASNLYLTHTVPRNKLILLDVISKSGLSTYEKIGSYADVIDYCEQNKVYPVEL